MPTHPNSKTDVMRPQVVLVRRDQSTTQSLELARNIQMRDIVDEDIHVLAQIILNAYLEWKQPLPTSGSQVSDK